MQRRRRRNRKNIITVYIARAVVALVLIIMIVLMFCGCLYIRDLFTKDDTDTKTDVEADADVSSNKDNNSVEDEPEPDPVPEFSVVIDAGHGGNDGGTLNGDIIEKTINLPVAFEIKSILEAQNIEVIMTRTTDDFVSLDDRILIANQADADMFVSVHCNYFEGDSSVDGLEVFYCPNAESSQKLAETIAESARQMDEIAVRGATENSYYVTKHTKMDAVLIEMGFLSNEVECQKLISSDYQKVLAQAIADGIVQALENGGTVGEQGIMEEESDVVN